jgi:FtsH-binding integral membrane protein
MAPSQPPAPTGAPLLHRFLGFGLVLIAIAAIVAKNAGFVSTPPTSDATRVLSYAFAAIAVMLVVVAFLFLKPRVPERRPEQSVQAYWSTPEIAAKALMVWFVLEGGAMMGVLGYFVTGEMLAAGAALFGIAAFWLCGPNVFARE